VLKVPLNPNQSVIIVVEFSYRALPRWCHDGVDFQFQPVWHVSNLGNE